MKILLVAINAKYIHSNLAVYSLQAYAKEHGRSVDVAEYTINQKQESVLREIYLKKPDLLVFSCYIWNLEFVLSVSREFHKLCPCVPVWAGGPEVSYEVETFLKDHRQFAGVMMGEGEATFTELCRIYEQSFAESADETGSKQGEKLYDALAELDGIAYAEPDLPDERKNHSLGTGGNLLLTAMESREDQRQIRIQPLRHLLSMDELPFCYDDPDVFAHKIIYYESSRGCPFHCSYCLSSIDKTLRFRSLDLVYRELQVFLDHRVPQVKFVDRTFNCSHDHAFHIWKYIKEHDNGITNFHFEVSADLLNEEELALIQTMRPGLIQLEIGVQSTHPETIREIHRSMNLDGVNAAVERVKTFSNTHQHLDLIAGLPMEDYATFSRSFDEIYAWKPDQLQLGFLKVLKGSYMYEHAAAYGVLYQSEPPYEVLSTNWLSYDELLRIKSVEEMLEIHYNSGQFSFTLGVLEEKYAGAFSMFLELAEFYQDKGYMEGNHTRVQRADILLEFVRRKDPEREVLYREALIFDLYKIENSKKRPEWAPDRTPYKKIISNSLRELGLEHKYCHAEFFSCLQMKEDGRVTVRKNDCAGDGETSGSGQGILFCYEKRDPLTNEASRIRFM